MALEICKQKPLCCSEMKSIGVLLKRLCYPGPVSALAVGLSVFTITTDTQYAITSLHKYPFWLPIISDHLESDQVPLVAHGWNCHNCNQRLKFSTELCVLFIYIFGMENICTQII